MGFSYAGLSALLDLFVPLARLNACPTRPACPARPVKFFEEKSEAYLTRVECLPYEMFTL
jgi:hypothetical protein